MMKILYYLWLLSALLIIPTAQAVVGVVSGDNQTIPVGTASANVVFKVFDDLGNPRTGVVMNFGLLNPNGDAVNDGLAITTMPVDVNAMAFTRAKETATYMPGVYTLIGEVANEGQRAVAKLNVFAKGTDAKIQVASGGQQTINSGQPSQPVVFKVADVAGNPTTGVSIAFSLINPNGKMIQDGLTTTIAAVNQAGEATTQMKATAAQTPGSYALIGQLVNDSTNSIDTFIKVIAGAIQALTPISANNQNIPADTFSGELTFQLTDSFTNPIAGQTVNFSLIDPMGNPSTDGLTHSSAVSNNQGLVSTQLKPTPQVGTYTLTAKAAQDVNKQARLNVIVVHLNSGIHLIAGDQQVLSAGTGSQPIVFRVIGKDGAPASNNRVRFSLYDPAGNLIPNALTPEVVNTNAVGEAVTQVIARSEAGRYTLRAVLDSNPNEAASATLNYIAGTADRLQVIAGGNQSVPAGRPANPITLQLIDGFGNPVTGENILFSASNAAGNPVSGALTPTQSVTDASGQATTRFNAVSLQGSYLINAELADNKAIATSTQVFVTEPLPNLPSLGFGSRIDARGNFSKTNAVSFYGGTSVNGGVFKQENVQRKQDTADIQAYINVDKNHIGQIADTFVVFGLSPLEINAEEEYFMFNTPVQVEHWDTNIASLTAYQASITLTSTELLKIYQGSFSDAGILRVVFGYRLTNGTIIYNADQYINLIVYP